MSKSSSGSPSSRSPDGPLRTPTGKRRFSSSSNRAPLQTISESQLAAPPPIPAKSSLRNGSDVNLPQTAATGRSPLRTWFDNRTSTDTRRTAPPAYEWISGRQPQDNEYLDNGPVEGEKLAALRQAGGFRRNQKGGWLRLGLIVLAALIIIGLAVGLGVGLTVGRHHSSDAAPVTAGNDTQNLTFPLGQYSIVTALRTMESNCTSIAATWSCFPYSTYDPSDSASQSSSKASFNWEITNTSATYATNMTGPTPAEGIPANLSISAAKNPYGIPLSNLSLTYISSAGNASSPRYVFSTTMSKNVVPREAITADNIATECFFNQTVFSGALYLSAPHGYPNVSMTDSTQWPYAAEVSQISPAGDVPACYQYTDGDVGALLTNFTTPLTAGPQQCTCDYRNYS